MKSWNLRKKHIKFSYTVYSLHTFNILSHVNFNKTWSHVNRHMSQKRTFIGIQEMSHESRNRFWKKTLVFFITTSIFTHLIFVFSPATHASLLLIPAPIAQENHPKRFIFIHHKITSVVQSMSAKMTQPVFVFAVFVFFIFYYNIRHYGFCCCCPILWCVHSFLIDVSRFTAYNSLVKIHFNFPFILSIFHFFAFFIIFTPF